MTSNYQEETVPTWEHKVRRIVCETYDGADSDLEAGIRSETEDGWELVSCFPEQHRGSGMLKDDPPLGPPGSDPYDAIWQQPTGPTFIAVFKRPGSG